MSKVHVCKALLLCSPKDERNLSLERRGICEGSVMAVIEGVKSNITPGTLSNGWVKPQARVFVSSLSSPVMINAAVCGTFWINPHIRDKAESHRKQRHCESTLLSNTTDGVNYLQSVTSAFNMSDD